MYDDLVELCVSQDERHYLRLAVWLRSFLLEGEITGEAVNRQYGLIVRYYVPWTDSSDESVSFADCNGTIVNWLETRPGKSETAVTRDVFLKSSAVMWNGVNYNVADVVRCAANVSGAVHSRPDAKNAHLLPLANALFVAERRSGLLILQSIAKRIIQAYAHLREAVAGVVGTLRQDDPNCQPKYDEGLVKFNRSSFLEGALSSIDGSDIIVGLRVALEEQTEEEGAIFAMGLPGTGNARLSLGASKAGLRAEFNSKSGRQLVVVNQNFSVGNFLSVIVKLSNHWEDDSTISICVNRTQIYSHGRSVKYDGLNGKQIVGASLSGKKGNSFVLGELIVLKSDNFHDDCNLREYLIRKNSETR
jgi:hypothetical protein